MMGYFTDVYMRPPASTSELVVAWPGIYPALHCGGGSRFIYDVDVAITDLIFIDITDAIYCRGKIHISPQ